MMQKYIIFLFAVLFFTNCKKQKIPNNDSAVITEEYVTGNWTIKSTKSYLKVSDPLSSMLVNEYEKLLNDKLSKEASGKVLCFDNGKVYCIENGTLKSSSEFYVDEENTVHFTTNPHVLKFYIPLFYLKKNEEDVNKMTGYLGKKESLDLLEDDDSVDDFYMSLIKSSVKDAQCEIRFERDFTDYSYLY